MCNFYTLSWYVDIQERCKYKFHLNDARLKFNGEHNLVTLYLHLSSSIYSYPLLIASQSVIEELVASFMAKTTFHFGARYLQHRIKILYRASGKVNSDENDLRRV